MWEHAMRTIRCPRCKSGLRLNSLLKLQRSRFEVDEKPAWPNGGSDSHWIENGALFCDHCRVVYPIHKGVPILLTYKTAIAEMTVNSWPESSRNAWLGGGFQLSSDQAPKGEKFVSASFSTEWADYDYDATLWTASTEDRIQTFRGECGLKAEGLKDKRFCEIGCGLGIITNEAARGLNAEAWGMDLSGAVFRAAMQYCANPMLHFVQASIFAPPFESGHFDFIYSHGVLHHTWSTKEALGHAAMLVRNEGRLYVWLYGYDDVRISMTRRFAFGVEVVTRPLLARLPPSAARIALLPLIPVYQIASLFGKWSGTHGTVYTAKQAMHAARDRFTPLYAQRHEVQEVAGWLRELGFRDIQPVRENEVAPTWSLAIKRNVAIRAGRG